MRGFFPLTASALLLLLLSLTLSLQAVRLERSSLQEAPLQELVVAGTNFRKDLEDLCRHATYQALWEVGRRASSYRTGEERRGAVENLARELFSALPPSAADGRLLFLPGEGVEFHLSPLENGFCLLRVRMPGSSLSVLSPDRSSSLSLPLEELEVFIDSRFFLLQERMDLFLQRVGEVEREWRNAQYLQAWTMALTGRVELSRSFAEGSLLAAWSAQELRTFGSLDYLPSRPLQDRVEVLDLLKRMRERTERLRRELEENLPVEGLEELEEECQRLHSLVEKSEDPLVGMLSRGAPDYPSFLLRLLWNLSGVRHLLEGEVSQEELLSLPPPLRRLEDGTPVYVEGENQGNLASLLLLLREAVEEFGRVAGTYELPGAPPVRESPGLSVLRELEVREVRFQREDPSGLLGLSSATPLLLPFLGVRVWWAQWRTEVTLEREPVEEIQDYPYPTLLLPGLPSRVPLAYRFEIPKRKFETRVVVFSPWPFSVSS